MGRKKTERKYTPLESVSHFAEKIGAFGDSIAYRYFDKDRNLLSITYGELSARIKKTAAGYAAGSKAPRWSFFSRLRPAIYAAAGAALTALAWLSPCTAATAVFPA